MAWNCLGRASRPAWRPSLSALSAPRRPLTIARLPPCAGAAPLDRLLWRRLPLLHDRRAPRGRAPLVLPGHRPPPGGGGGLPVRAHRRERAQSLRVRRVTGRRRERVRCEREESATRVCRDEPLCASRATTPTGGGPEEGGGTLSLSLSLSLCARARQGPSCAAVRGILPPHGGYTWWPRWLHICNHA